MDIVFSLKNKTFLKIYCKNEKNAGKVGEFCQFVRVGKKSNIAW